MKATTGAAMLAMIGLLALSACFHDDSERPATGETDESTETFDDLRGTNAAEILDVTGEAAVSLPQFGGRRRCSVRRRRHRDRFRRLHKFRRH